MLQVDMLGLSHLTSAFGILTCIRGLSAFLGPPVGGFVIDMTSPETIEEDDGSPLTEWQPKACLRPRPQRPPLAAS